MSTGDDQIMLLLKDPATSRRGFEMLVRQYSEPLYWKIRHFVLTHEDANDVLQNTFVKAWVNLGGFKGDAKISTWLYRIAINESLDFLRKQKAVNKISTDAEQGVSTLLMADEYFDGDEMQAQLQEAIAHLPDVQRTVFNLRYYEGMKYSEISRILNTSEGSLKASYHIAVQKISDYFKHKN
ncbi:RNA polymerase sigma factor [Prevotella sp. KH2C16]|uniref:RNA polymerase sigma factor n=1 Tax=Prevotella sp. KH2C16 TaxID=1855325 RepID=UPI0008E21A30|nr:sigma-70 family RNA polymerase sigma factor [Prevotella sp. KH2C16]SFF98390.1 RNA polymerase sigma-70 factor, ECF subfamily [Prevotella sp. KH2C16]